MPTLGAHIKLLPPRCRRLRLGADLDVLLERRSRELAAAVRACLAAVPCPRGSRERRWRGAEVSGGHCGAVGAPTPRPTGALHVHRIGLNGRHRAACIHRQLVQTTWVVGQSLVHLWVPAAAAAAAGVVPVVSVLVCAVVVILLLLLVLVLVLFRLLSVRVVLIILEAVATAATAATIKRCGRRVET